MIKTDLPLCLQALPPSHINFVPLKQVILNLPWEFFHEIYFCPYSLHVMFCHNWLFVLFCYVDKELHSRWAYGVLQSES